jgi:cell division septal protein FtsQ
MTNRPAARRPVSPRPTGRRSAASAHLRRTRSIRRASAGLGRVRAGAALVLLVSTAALYGTANSAAFRYENLQVDGAVLTPRTAIEAALETARGENLFRLQTSPLETRLRTLATVARANVSVRLPDTLVVQLTERAPILVWRVGQRRFLADAEGYLFGELGDGSSAEAKALPIIDDRRTASVGLTLGVRLDPVDLDAATRLGSLVPADAGSEAQSLVVSVTDASGYVVTAKPGGWDAVFGFYTASLRTPELIPGQVRLLRSLLIGREQLIERVILASDTDGTFVAKPTPTPAESARP